MRFDTIVALMTGAPPAAVACIRLSGPEAYDVASKVFRPWPSFPTPRFALYGHFLHGDDGIALPFEEGHSFTGEPVVELSVHGSRASITGLLEACEVAGARPARPGEFTMRAFMNGRLDLAQAEAVAETVEAATDWQLRLANRNREGHLSRKVRVIRDRLVDVLAALEASVDFPDEAGEVDLDAIASTTQDVAQELNDLVEAGSRSHLARQGLRIAIVGRPNAGKSSLLNALLGINRSIVTEIPGTTRDTIEEMADLGGIAVVLIDTAGMRETGDAVERIGVERALQSAAAADMIWYVYDALEGWTSLDEEAVAQLPMPPFLIGNKADLAAPEKGLPVSALTGLGLEELTKHVASDFAESSESVATNDRQTAALRLALEAVGACHEAAMAEHPPDLLSVFLRDALNYLGRITGDTASPEMLEEIFSRFCIGK